MSLLGRVTLWSSQLANKRGLYAGPRAGKVHVALYQRSGGRLGGHLPGVRSAHVLLLDHVGAKSGTPRTSPLVFVREGDSYAVVASKAGQPTNPAWFHNLMANADTTIQVGADVLRVRARRATEEERARVWPEFVSFGYDFYQRLAKDRKIPVVILEPR